MPSTTRTDAAATITGMRRLLCGGGAGTGGRRTGVGGSCSASGLLPIRGGVGGGAAATGGACRNAGAGGANLEFAPAWFASSTGPLTVASCELFLPGEEGGDSGATGGAEGGGGGASPDVPRLMGGGGGLSGEGGGGGVGEVAGEPFPTGAGGGAQARGGGGGGGGLGRTGGGGGGSDLPSDSMAYLVFNKSGAVS